MNNSSNSNLTRLWGFICLLTIGAVWLCLDSFTPINKVDLHGWMLILVYFVSFIIIFKINNYRLVPFIFFFLYCFVSNAGQTLVELFNLPHLSDVNIYITYSDERIAQMLSQQGAIILFMVLGYLFFKGSSEGLESIKIQTLEDKNENGIKFNDVLFIIICFAIMVTYAGELVKRSQMSYGDYYYESREGNSTVFQYIYHVYGFSYILTHTGKKKNLATFTMLAIAVVIVFIGSRSNTIPFLVGIITVSFLTNKKVMRIKFWHILLGLIILYMLSGFTELRNYSLNQIDMSLLKEIYGVSAVRSIVNIVMEMGASARTTISTMVALDIGIIQHDNTIIYYILKGIFPIQILELLHINKPAISSLSAWVTDYNNAYSGWGFSIIGEIIYNFGSWSWVFGFVFGGMWIGCERLIARFIKEKNVFLASSVLYVLGYAVFLARAETALMSTRIRYTVYFIILYYIYLFIFKKKEKGVS